MSNSDKANSLETIKNVLLKEELSQLNQLLEDTGNKEKKLEELTEMIAEAIARRAHKDNAIAASLTPILERSLANAIRKDPKMMADAIFPIIGPAIRRSVVEMVNHLFEQINQAARQNIFNKLRWKLMAKRSGRSYAEVVFSQTLEYQVEQAFLIHNKTGAMLLHASIREEGNQDADLVSSMLTAINNFVEDSFKSGGIEQIKLGELTLLVKAGPLAHLAILVRGEIHSEKVNDKLNEVIETIHLIHANELAHFNGNVDTYKDSQYLLEECLMSSGKNASDKTATERFKKYVQLTGVAALILAFIYIPFYLKDKELHQTQQDYIARLENLSEVSVLSTETKDGNLIIHLLADPSFYASVENTKKPQHVILKPHFVKLLKK